MSKINNLDKSNIMIWLNFSAKALLFLCFIIAIVFTPPQLEGKAMEMRVPFYLGAALLFPIIGYFKKWKPYPHTGDFLFIMPFLLDTMGNMFGLFDSVVIFDDLIHAINWMFIVMAYHAFRFRKISDNRDAILLGIGVGALLIIFWEGIEFLVSPDGLGIADNLNLTYVDTVSDLILSTLGGIVGSVLGVKLFGNK